MLSEGSMSVKSALLPDHGIKRVSKGAAPIKDMPKEAP